MVNKISMQQNTDLPVLDCGDIICACGEKNSLGILEILSAWQTYNFSLDVTDMPNGSIASDGKVQNPLDPENPGHINSVTVMTSTGGLDLGDPVETYITCRFCERQWDPYDFDVSWV